MNGILIEPVIDGKIHGFSVQAKQFSLALKITNMTDSPSEEFTINNFSMQSSQGQNIVETFGRKSYYVRTINPGESVTINIGSTGQFIYGVINLSLTAVPKTTGIIIRFLQKNPFTNEIVFIRNNEWIDFSYIKSATEYLQEKTNNKMTILTYVLIVIAIIQVIIPFLQNISSKPKDLAEPNKLFLNGSLNFDSDIFQLKNN